MISSALWKCLSFDDLRSRLNIGTHKQILYRLAWFVGICQCASQVAYAQNVEYTGDSTVFTPDTTAIDSIPLPPDSSNFSKKWHMAHSPMKATIYSTILPGAGQLYNKKGWKVPIVYAGLGTCIGFVIYNNNKYQYYLDAYKAEVDGDASTINDTEYNESGLFELQDTYHSWRDLSYIFLAGVYLLQIIDANVDAHLWHFDVGEDLSMTLRPSIIHTGQFYSSLSLSIQF
jgi:hypothetical protein